MKESMVKMLDFLKKNKYGRAGVAVLLVGIVISIIVFARQSAQEEPIPLRQVAGAFAAEQVVRIEDDQEKGLVIIHYKDGSEKVTRRDRNSSFLEQMQLLGVSDAKLARLNYQIIEPDKVTGEAMINLFVTLAMLGTMGFLVTRMGGGSLAITQKKYTEGAIPDTTFRDVAGIDECREELVDIVTFLKGSAHYKRLNARMPRGV